MNPIIVTLAAATASILFGASVTATRSIIHVIDPLTLAIARYALGALLLLPFMLLGRMKPPALKDILAVAGLGTVFFGCFPWLFNAGLQYIPSTRAGIWLATMPFLTFLLSAVLRYEAITLIKIAGLVLAGIGVALTLLQGGGPLQGVDEAWKGDLLYLATACCGAFYFVMSRPVLRRWPAQNVTGFAMASGSIFLMVVGGVGAGHVPADYLALLSALSPAHLAIVLFLGSCGGAIAYFLWGWALRHATPTRVAIFLSLNPVTAALCGAWFLQEALSVQMAFGLAFVISGIFIVNRPTPQTPVAGLQEKRA